MMKRTGLALLATLVLAACGGDNTGPDGDGNGDGNGATSSKVTVSGGVTATYEGTAGFAGAENTEDGTSFFAIAGGEEAEESTNAFMFVRDNSARPGTGDYVIGDSDENENVFGGIVTTGDWLIGAESGTLKITSSSSDRIKGTFSFTGTAISAENTDGVEVTVTGTFDAMGDDEVVVMKRSAIEVTRVRVAK
jgi:hypothetical protein